MLNGELGFAKGLWPEPAYYKNFTAGGLVLSEVTKHQVSAPISPKGAIPPRLGGVRRVVFNAELMLPDV